MLIGSYRSLLCCPACLSGMWLRLIRHQRGPYMPTSWWQPGLGQVSSTLQAHMCAPAEVPLHAAILQPPSCFVCVLQVPLLVDLQWVTPLLAKLGGWAGILQLAQAKAQALDPAGRSSVPLSMAFQAGEDVRSLREVGGTSIRV